MCIFLQLKNNLKSWISIDKCSAIPSKTVKNLYKKVIIFHTYTTEVWLCTPLYLYCLFSYCFTLTLHWTAWIMHDVRCFLPLTVRCTQLPLWKVSYCCSNISTLHSYQPWSSERTSSIRREDLPYRVARPGQEAKREDDTEARRMVGLNFIRKMKERKEGERWMKRREKRNTEWMLKQHQPLNDSDINLQGSHSADTDVLYTLV